MSRRKTHKVLFPHGRDGGFMLACGQETLFMNQAGVLVHADNSMRWSRVTCERCKAKRRPKKGRGG